ncbi:MAG: LamG domain-containing protein [Planctomycetes bacterium]|nr:LamG domain-containing protein [Planctomycetota bacterium]
MFSLSGALAAEEGLVAHWPLRGNAADASGNALRTVEQGIDFSVAGPDGSPGTAAAFDGLTSSLEVPVARSLNLGTGDFSILTWAHTDVALDDLPGEIISCYDPATRTGFRLGIDSRPGVTSSQANWRNLHFGIDQSRSEPEWTDHGRLGNAVLIYSMAVYDDRLFVGTCEAARDQAGRVFAYDGREWTDCGAPDRCNAISSLAVHDGRLYAAASKYRLAGSSLPESQNPHTGGNVYRYEAPGHWIHCGSLPEAEAIGGMVVYRGRLYAGSMYAPAGFFRYEGGTNWTPCGTPAGKRVEALTVHNGHIYATGYDEGAVYRFDGEDWTHLGRIAGANQTYGFAVHRGELYVSEWPHARVFRYGGGTEWLPVGRLGEEMETMPLVVYNGKLYAGTLPSAEVYRFDVPETWTKVGRLDFTPDVRYRRVWTMAVYQGRLFAGTLPSGRVHSIEIGRNVTHDRALEPGWRHIAAVRESHRLKLYVDGRLVGTSAQFAPADYDLSNDRPLRIGFGTTDHFKGRLSDLRLYGLALTPAEIREISGIGRD